VGKAVAQHAGKEWLRRRRNAAERNSTLAELAAAELNSPLRRSKLDNALEAIGFQAAEHLEPLLAAEFGALPENEFAAAVAAAVDVLRETGACHSFRVSHGMRILLLYHRGSRPGKRTARVFRAIFQPCVPVPDSPPLLLEMFRRPR
jgi:hypothetical protein